MAARVAVSDLADPEPGLPQSVVCIAHSFSLPGEIQYCPTRCLAGYPEVIDRLLERPAQDSVEVAAGGNREVVDRDVSRNREDRILVHRAGCRARDEVGEGVWPLVRSSSFWGLVIVNPKCL